MIALSRETTYGLLAFGAVIVVVVLVLARYGTVDPCDMLRQDLIRSAEKRGESAVATELLFEERRPRLGIGGCIGAYLSFAPSTYIRQF